MCRVSRAVYLQGPGEFVVTFPGAYHCGFNTGLNCAEAVNVAPADWLRYGRAGSERYRSFRRTPLLSYQWLLLQVGLGYMPTCQLCYCVQRVQRQIRHAQRWWPSMLIAGHCCSCVEGS